MELKEETFLSLFISEAILAVAIEDQILNTGEATRASKASRAKSVRAAGIAAVISQTG